MLNQQQQMSFQAGAKTSNNPQLSPRTPTFPQSNPNAQTQPNQPQQHQVRIFSRLLKLATGHANLTCKNKVCPTTAASFGKISSRRLRANRGYQNLKF